MSQREIEVELEDIQPIAARQRVVMDKTVKSRVRNKLEIKSLITYPILIQWVRRGPEFSGKHCLNLACLN